MQSGGDIEHGVVVEVEAGDRPVGNKLRGLLYDIYGLVAGVELQHAVLVRIADVIGEHGGAVLARHGLGKFIAQTMTIKNIVAQDERDLVAVDEFPPQDERMGEAGWLLLNDVAELDAPCGAVTKQTLIERQMLTRRNEQNIADLCQHQN